MTTRQKQLIENYIRLKVKKLMKEESAKDYPELFSFFNSLNEKMKDIDFLVDNFSKELK